MVELTADYFWYSEKADGQVCEACNLPISGNMFQPVMQFGKIEDLNFTDIKLQLCQKCYMKLPDNKR